MRDIIISVLPIIWLMFIEIMLFQLGSHTSSYPKLMNNGREGRMEGATDSGAVGQYFPGVVMIWCWRDDTCSDFTGRGALQAWARRAGAVIFQCLYPVTSEQCLVHKRHLKVIPLWIAKLKNKTEFVHKGKGLILFELQRWDFAKIFQSKHLIHVLPNILNH